MKKFFALLVVILLFCACRENAVEFTLEQSTANVFVNSSPSEAQIYLNNSFTGKMTPDTLKYLEPGSYMVTLKLSGYKDSSKVISVEPADRISIFILMRDKL